MIPPATWNPMSGATTPYMDDSKARRPGREVQRVNVDFPVDLLAAIDREARRIGVTRQAWGGPRPRIDPDAVPDAAAVAAR
jgi:hypothetical protein